MRCWLPLFLALVTGPLPATAGLVRLEFEGVITEIRDDFDLLPDVPVGAVFAGKYAYDDSIQPIACGAGLGGSPITVDDCATYASRGNPAPAIRLEVGGTTFNFSNASSPTVPLSISIGARGLDWYSARWLRDILPDGRRQDWVEIAVRGPTGSLFASTQLAVPDVDAADSATFTFLAQQEGVPVSELSEEQQRLRELLFCRDSGGGCGDPRDDLPFRISTIAGDLTRLRVVPEPHAAVLLLPFGVLLTSLRRHRQRLQSPHRMSNMPRLLAPLLLMVTLLPFPARAAPVTVEFDGVVTAVQDDFDLLPDLATGSPFSGFYSYDDSLPGGLCPPGIGGISGGGGQLPVETCAQYDSGATGGGIQFTIDGQQFGFDNNESPAQPLLITIVDSDSDAYRVQWSRTGSLPPDDNVLLALVGESGILVHSTDLVVPGSAGVTLASLMYSARSTPSEQRLVIDPVTGLPMIVELGGESSSITGDIISLRVVPEPTAALLLVMFGLLLGGLRALLAT